MQPSDVTLTITDVAPTPMPAETVPVAVPPAWMQRSRAGCGAEPSGRLDGAGGRCRWAVIFRPETVTCSIFRVSDPAKLIVSVSLDTAVVDSAAVAPSEPGAVTTGVPEKVDGRRAAESAMPTWMARRQGKHRRGEAAGRTFREGERRRARRGAAPWHGARPRSRHGRGRERRRDDRDKGGEQGGGETDRRTLPANVQGVRSS